MSITLTLPSWTRAYSRRVGQIYATRDERLLLAVELSLRNVEHRTGGPFGAAVFERETGRLVAFGVNLVESLGLSVAHAEIVALCFAQRRAGGFDLGREGGLAHEIFCSAQPCAMCAGALVWSGVASVVYAAERRDVERIVGFDEGPLAPRWAQALAARGIAVHRGKSRGEALAALRAYVAQHGAVYNSGRPTAETKTSDPTRRLASKSGPGRGRRAPGGSRLPGRLT